MFLTLANGGHVTPSIDHQDLAANLTAQGLGIQNYDMEGARVAWEYLSRQLLGITKPRP